MTPKLFQNHPNNFRTFPEPFHTFSELLPDHRNSFRIISLSPTKSYIIPEPISWCRQDLKFVTLRFENTPDMVETLCSPMTVRDTWKYMTTPVHSTNIVVEP